MLTKTKNLWIILALLSGMFSHRFVYAQDSVELDSLYAQVPNTHRHNLLAVYDRIAGILGRMDKNHALTYSKRSLTQANADANNALAQTYALRNLGQIYADLNNKAEALRSFQEAVERSRMAQEPFGMAIALYTLGTFQSRQGLYAEALRQILEASRQFEDLKEYNYAIRCHNECSTIHYKARNFQLSIEEAYRVLDFMEMVDPQGLSKDQDFQRMTTYNTLALSNADLGHYDEAISNYDRAEQYANKLENEFWIGLINGNKANVLKKLGRVEEAIRSLEYDMTTSRKFKVWFSAANASIHLSELYIDREEYAKARIYQDSAEKMFRRESDKIQVRRGLSSLQQARARLQAGLGDYAGAYSELSRHVELRDSLYHEQEAFNLAKLRASYDLDRKQTEIELLTKNNEIQQVRLRSQRMLFIASLGGLVLLSVLVVNLIVSFRRQRAKTKLIRLQHNEIEAKNAELSAQSTQLQENNQYIQSLNLQLEQKVADRTLALEAALHELDTFLYRSSHDMRRPITTLLGLDLLARYAVKDEQALMLFGKVVETARSMDGMLYKMQMVYELNKTEFGYETVELNGLVESCLHQFQPELEQYRIAYHTAFPGFVTLRSCPVLLTIIFRNLLENAIMFRRDLPDVPCRIDIQVSLKPDMLEITVSDNGMGVEAKYQPQIFDLYFRASSASKGNGLGLYLVKKAVHKLSGTIVMRSTFGMGTTFSIHLPIPPVANVPTEATTFTSYNQ